MSKLVSLDFLEGKVLEDVNFLINISNENDKIDLSCPINEEGTKYFLIYEKDILVSLLCLYRYDYNEYDCIAFTLPKYRNKGYFNELFDYALDYLETKPYEDGIKLNFNIYDTCKGAVKTLESLEAIYSNSEAFMSLNLLEYNIENEYENIDNIHIKINNELASYIEYTLEYKGRKIGEFYLLNQDEKVYFYGFEIYEKYRGLGYGSLSMRKIILYLISQEYKTIFLQVSMDNIAAYNLYKKLGFVQDKKLDMYYIVV